MQIFQDEIVKGYLKDNLAVRTFLLEENHILIKYQSLLKWLVIEEDLKFKEVLSSLGIDIQD